MNTLRWGTQCPGERVLRIWLGGTFTYAGVEKLADPGFLTKGSTTYIGSQIDGFAQGSPIGPLLHLAAHAPVLAGVAVAVTEILIGIATLAGVAPAIAATAGVLLSVTLWLSASWHIYPYFLGSDSIYAVAWLAYLLSLPGLIAFVAEVRERRHHAGLDETHDEDPLSAAALNETDEAAVTNPSEHIDERRRQVVRGGAVVIGGVALGGIAGLLGRSRHTKPQASATKTVVPKPTATSTATASGAGTPITELGALRTQQSVNFIATNGDPAVVVALPNGTPVAFSRVCTHTGCAASYDTSSKLIVCPCHGSRFDPAAAGAAVRGPATRPLPGIPIQVNSSTGEIRLP